MEEQASYGKTPLSDYKDWQGLRDELRDFFADYCKDNRAFRVGVSIDGGDSHIMLARSKSHGRYQSSHKFFAITVPESVAIVGVIMAEIEAITRGCKANLEGGEDD